MLNVLNTSLPIPMSSTVFLEGTEGRTGEACRSVQSCCLLSKGCRNHITVILCIPSVKTNSSKLTPLSTRLPHLSLYPRLSAGLCPSTPASPPTRNTPNMHNTELIPASAPTFLSSIPIGIKLDLQALSWVPEGLFSLPSLPLSSLQKRHTVGMVAPNAGNNGRVSRREPKDSKVTKAVPQYRSRSSYNYHLLGALNRANLLQFHTPYCLLVFLLTLKYMRGDVLNPLS